MLKAVTKTPAAAILLTTMLAVPQLHAQTIRGTVKDGSTGAPIADASVVLLDEDGRLQRGTLTQPDGMFVLVAPTDGMYTLRIGAADYQTTETAQFRLEQGREDEVDVLLQAEHASWPPQAFFERMRRGDGLFFTREEIEARPANSFIHIFEHTPGVRIVSYTLRLSEYALDCPPVLWVDGVWWGSIDERDTLHPDDLEAIEVYGHLSIVPDEFNTGPEAMCGVIVVWRKRKP